MSRSLCDMVCYEWLKTIPHPFGSQEDVEKEKFRKLVRHLCDTQAISRKSYDLLNSVYDLGNN